MEAVQPPVIGFAPSRPWPLVDLHTSRRVGGGHGSDGRGFAKSGEVVAESAGERQCDCY